MSRYALTDEQWALVEPLWPPPARTGRPRRDGRQILDAIFHALRTGCPWRDLPERYGPWQSAYHYFNTSRASGLWERILQTLRVRLDAAGGIDWSLFCVDGTSVRADPAASGAGQRGATPSRRTTAWAALAGAGAARSTCSATGPGCRWRRWSRRARGTSPRSSIR